MKKKAFTRIERLGGIAGMALPPSLTTAKRLAAHPWHADTGVTSRHYAQTPNEQAWGVVPQHRANPCSNIKVNLYVNG
jgi:hypothetical protein